MNDVKPKFEWKPDPEYENGNCWDLYIYGCKFGWIANWGY